LLSVSLRKNTFVLTFVHMGSLWRNSECCGRYWLKACVMTRVVAVFMGAVLHVFLLRKCWLSAPLQWTSALSRAAARGKAIRNARYYPCKYWTQSCFRTV
jgi:hypothetical protein